MKAWRFACTSGVLAALIFAYSSVLRAGEVSLEQRENGFRVTGELLSFDGEKYKIESRDLGTLIINAQKFHCVDGDCPYGTRIDGRDLLRIAGSATIGYELLPALVRKYAEVKGGKASEFGDGAETTIELHDRDGNLFRKIEIQRKGSERAFTALENGSADIGTSVNAISDAQIGQFAKAGQSGMDKFEHEHIVGLDGLVIVTSEKNPISSLSLEDISKIFSGEIKDWSEFGLDSRPIVVYARNHDSGIADAFNKFVLAPYKRKLTNGATFLGTNAEVVRAAAADPGGIGFTSISEQGGGKPIDIKDSCGIIHQPTAFAVKSGEYPLNREFYFYTIGKTQRKVSDFVGFSVSPQGQETIEQAGFVSRRIISASFDDFSGRIIAGMVAPEKDFDLELMRQLMQDLKVGKRLSTTIRFEQRGDVKINAESWQQLSSIIDYISDQGMARHKVLLVGFSDSTGSFANNMAVSLKRANAVRDALLVLGIPSIRREDIEVKAYGKLFPAACNDTSDGRSKNRRVEVWLVPRYETPVVLSRQP